MSAAWREKFSRAGVGAGAGADAGADGGSEGVSEGGSEGGPTSSYDASASAAFFEGLAAACYAAAWQLSVGIGSSVGYDALAASSVSPRYVPCALNCFIYFFELKF